MMVQFLLFCALSLTPAQDGADALLSRARNCFERGERETCDSLLTELAGRKLKLIERRKVCQLIMDNAFYLGDQVSFRKALNSSYVQRNMDRSDYDYWCNVSRFPTETVWREASVSTPIVSGPRENLPYAVEVSLHGTRAVGMLDCCATRYCSISLQMAARLGVKPLGKEVKLNNNRRAKAYVGVLDSLVVGGLVVRNVLVDVSESFAAIQEYLKCDIILGGNFLREAGDMTIDNENGTVTFSKETLDLPRNVYFAHSTQNYYIEGSLNGHDVSMLFDTGNNKTNMSGSFYDRFPADEYAEGTVTRRMMDRTWTTKVQIIREARFEVCDAGFTLANVAVQLEDHGSRGDGNLGVDALAQFNKVVFNARKLYLRFL